MRANKGNAVPRAFLFFDTETVCNPEDPDEQVLEFGCVEYVRWMNYRGHKGWATPKAHTFWTAGDFWDLVEDHTSEKSTLWVMAHNAGGFDINVLGGVQPLIERGWELDFAIIECPPFMIDFRKGTKRIRICDSLNYVRASLADLGKSVGLDKLEDPYDPRNPPADPDGSILAKRVEYCQRDVTILRRFMLEGWFAFVQAHDMGNWAITAAAQAMNCWRHRFAPKLPECPDELDLWPSDDEPSAFEQGAYYGGRTESFYLGRVDEPVYCYDVNSLYPSVMLNEKYPVEMVDKGTSMTAWKAQAIIEGGDGLIADVTVSTDRPLFPRLNDEDRRLEFPTGTWTVRLATPELKLAIERDCVVKIGRWQRYRMADLFSAWVTEWYALRRKYKDEGNELWATIVKLVMNSLYGKFGQRVPGWERILPEDMAEAPEGFEWDGCYVEVGEESTNVYRLWGPIIERKMPDDRPRSAKAFPAIAAHVTSAARLVFLSGVEGAGWEHTYYGDTDSVFVDGIGRANLERSGVLSDSVLGKWKLDKQGPGITIWGLKGYEFDGKRTIKGVRKTATEVGPHTYVQPVFRSFRGNIYHGTMGKQIVADETKILSWNYTKGVPTESGWVRPHRVDNP